MWISRIYDLFKSVEAIVIYDASFDLLKPLLKSCETESVWVIGEQTCDYNISANANIKVLSNRIDIINQLTALGWQAEFGDFNFSIFKPGSLSAIFMRVAKERALMHYIINNAAIYLKQDGILYLAGAKNQGIKTYAKNAGMRLAGAFKLKKHGTSYLLTAKRAQSVNSQALDDRNYACLREFITEGELSFYSKPGLFAWDKVDAGSAYLVANLPAFIACINGLGTIKSILDLGCGMGYLAIHASILCKQAEITATDNNASAIAACRANFDKYQINGQVIADDCASRLTGAFDLVLCNPPFHKGFGIEPDLTHRFVKTAAKLVAHNGAAIFVVNNFIAIEAIAEQYFEQVENFASNDRFKLIQMLVPKRL